MSRDFEKAFFLPFRTVSDWSTGDSHSEVVMCFGSKLVRALPTRGDVLYWPLNLLIFESGLDFSGEAAARLRSRNDD